MNIKNRSAMVVLSGGQDSTFCVFWAKQHFDTVHALTFDYGQKHSIEIDAAKKIVELAELASHEIVILGNVLSGISPLVNQSERLEEYDSFENMESIIGDRTELTFVPMRNALFLTIAANKATCLGIDNLVTGVCQADNANYPDCRESFIQSQRDTINQALDIESFEIITPIIHLPKADAIKQSLTMPGAYEALAWTHTAYDGKYPPLGRDHASVLRRQEFEVSGLPDPLVIRAWHEKKMELPTGPNYSKDLTAWALEERKVHEFRVRRELGAAPPVNHLSSLN